MVLIDNNEILSRIKNLKEKVSPEERHLLEFTYLVATRIIRKNGFFASQTFQVLHPQAHSYFCSIMFQLYERTLENYAKWEKIIEQELKDDENNCTAAPIGMTIHIENNSTRITVVGFSVLRPAI